MKADKHTLPIYISVVLSSITFLGIWVFGEKALLVFHRGLFPAVFLLWIFLVLLLMARKDLRRIVSQTAITSAFVIYLGAMFISLSRFKAEIAESSIDINMIGIGLALIAIALALTTHHREHEEQKLEAANSAKNSTPEMPSESGTTMSNEALPSIDIALDEARRTLDFQFKQLDGLDTKSGMMVGFAGVIIALLVSTSIGVPDLMNSLIAEIVASIIGVTLLVSLLLSYKNLRIGKWQRPPEIEALINDYVSKDSNTTKCELIGTIQKAVRENEALLKTRFCLYRRSYNILFVGLLVVTISVITLLFIR